MHVTIVDEELPFPLNSGKRIRTFQLVTRLARGHRITYICHRNADPREAMQAQSVFRDLGIETVVVDRRYPRNPARFFSPAWRATCCRRCPTRSRRTKATPYEPRFVTTQRRTQSISGKQNGPHTRSPSRPSATYDV